MGWLKLFSKPVDEPLKLPSGSFTVDRRGSVVTSTLPRQFPEDLVRKLATDILETFREAEAAGLNIQELSVLYAAFKINARSLRGGAIVFVAPRSLSPKQRLPS